MGLVTWLTILDRPACRHQVITARPETEDEARQYRERFLREARRRRPDHPNIVAVHDIGQDPETGRPYIVMEHVEGQDLKR